MNKIYNFTFTNQRDLSIYYDKELFEIMNIYNKVTFENIDALDRLLDNHVFKVPHVIYEYPWGKEKVFYPFTSKLFKVLETSISDTSLQIHPLKSEAYYSLNDSTIVNDNYESFECKTGDYIFIPNNTMHTLLTGSKVFEEQDNLIFDANETVRIIDKLDRKVAEPQEYVKYLLPQFLKKCIKQEVVNYDGQHAKFIFVSNGSVEIEYNGIVDILSEKDELYYISDDVNIIKCTGFVRIIKCEFYRVS